MQPYENVERSKKQIIINNFIGGVSWGLGVTVGLGILLAILGFFLSKIDLVPFIGQSISTGIEGALKNNPQFFR